MGYSLWGRKESDTTEWLQFCFMWIKALNNSPKKPLGGQDCYYSHFADDDTEAQGG